jgi:RNA-binding protein
LLREAGIFIHVSNTGFVVAKANPNRLPKIGSEIITRKLERVGNVYDIIGPVKSPFLLIKPEKKNLKNLNLVDEKLFVKGDDHVRNRKGKGSRKEGSRKRGRGKRN